MDAQINRDKAGRCRERRGSKAAPHLALTGSGASDRVGYPKSVALEVAQSGITVNAVCPGFIETEMLQAVPEKVRDSIRSRIPLGRFGQPAEVGKLVRFLCAEGDWVTGQEFSINGGQSM